MSNTIRLKKKSLISVFIVELGALILVHLLNSSTIKKLKAHIRNILSREYSFSKSGQKRYVKRLIPMYAYHSLTMQGKIDVAYRVFGLIESYPLTFVAPIPSMKDFKTVIDELSDAYHTYMIEGRTRYYHAKMMEKEAAFKLIFKDVIRYVEEVTQNEIKVYRKAVIGHL